MDKDEILEKAKKENKKNEPLEQEALKLGNKIGILFGCIFCFVFMIIEITMHSLRFCGFYAIIFAILTGAYIGKAIKLKRKTDIILSVLYAVAALLWTVMYIYGLIKS